MKKIDIVHVQDNLLSDDEADNLFNNLISTDFPWFFFPATIGQKSIDMMSDENTYENFQLFHNFLNDRKINSIKIDMLELFMMRIGEVLNGEPDFIRIKANIKTKVTTNLIYNTPHVDNLDKHHVLIYYANDSDGDTFIFDSDCPPWNIVERISPKKGRFILFDGKYYHSGMHPKTTEQRMVINVNIGGLLC